MDAGIHADIEREMRSIDRQRALHPDEWRDRDPVAALVVHDDYGTTLTSPTPDQKRAVAAGEPFTVFIMDKHGPRGPVFNPTGETITIDGVTLPIYEEKTP